MYGVVLWRDKRGDRTLIWCEDHGNLAFFKAKDDLTRALRSGDLVRFDTTEEGKVRIAHNLSLVAAEEYPSLATSLLQAEPCVPRPGPPEDSKIVPFSPRSYEDAPIHPTALRRRG